MPFEFVFLLPGDQTVSTILPYQGDKIRIQPLRGFHFLDVHQESAIAGNSENSSLGIYETCGNRAGQREAHGAKTVWNKTRIGLVTMIVSGDPHFVCTHV